MELHVPRFSPYSKGHFFIFPIFYIMSSAWIFRGGDLEHLPCCLQGQRSLSYTARSAAGGCNGPVTAQLQYNLSN